VERVVIGTSASRLMHGVIVDFHNQDKVREGRHVLALRDDCIPPAVLACPCS
jgi:hypothetical protein